MVRALQASKNPDSMSSLPGTTGGIEEDPFASPHDPASPTTGTSNAETGDEGWVTIAKPLIFV